LIKLRW